MRTVPPARPAFSIDTTTGLIVPSRHVPSPNHDARPAGVAADLIVIHGISMPPGEYGGPWIDQLFTNCLPATAHPFFATVVQLRVSSHLLVRRDGTLVQYVPLHLRAWHAGVSSYQGREKCNDFSIGIELEGTDESPYMPAQYASLSRLIAALCAAYPQLSPTRVAGHCDIAPGRKTDPGPCFDWPRLHAMVRAEMRAP
jgi:N-acetyl-anhydromuramoyl-L-alanine amidase